jgi:hypothetical protein
MATANDDDIEMFWIQHGVLFRRTNDRGRALSEGVSLRFYRLPDFLAPLRAAHQAAGVG